MGPDSVVALPCSGLGIVNRGMEARAFETASMLRRRGVKVVLVGGGRPASPIQRSLPCIPRDSFIFGGHLSPIPWARRVRIEETTFSNMLVQKLSGMSLKNLLFFVLQPYVANRLQKAKKNRRIRAPIVVTNGFTHHPQRLQGFEFVHVLAPYYLELARQLGMDTHKWYFAPQPVNTEVFKPKPREEIRKSLEISQDDFVVLVAGAINWSYKRIDHAIREVAILKEAHRGAKLLVVGQVESETAYIVNLGRKLLGSDVIFRTTRHDNMPNVYAAGDVFVLPTRKEIIGNVFAEAMACGVPAVGDDYPVTKWIIEDGGDTVDMRRAGQLAGVLERYAKDESYRLNRSRRAHERALNYFSTDVIVPQYLKMFESIMQEASVGANA